MEIIIEKTCLICKKSFSNGGRDLYQETTKYSKSSFINILNNIQKLEMIENSKVGFGCKCCITKLNNYDQAIVTANEIREEIIELIENSKKTLELQLPILLQNTKIDENLDSINVDEKFDSTNANKNLMQRILNNTNKKDCKEIFKNVNIKLRIKNMKYECNECGMKFSKKYTLQCHQQSHMKKNNYSTNNEDNIIDFKCEHCDFIGKTQSILNGHKKRMHGNLKPFKCNFCDKRFAQSSSLNRHLPAHTGEKRFQCEKCGKKFGEYSSFRMHKFAHDNIREKECTICGLKFRSTSHLKRHTMVHSGEKPHKCSNCGKSFSQRYNMNLHLRKYCDINKIKKESE